MNRLRFLQKIDLPGEKRKIGNFSLLPWQINLLQKPMKIFHGFC